MIAGLLSLSTHPAGGQKRPPRKVVPPLQSAPVCRGAGGREYGVVLCAVEFGTGLYYPVAATIQLLHPLVRLQLL